MQRFEFRAKLVSNLLSRPDLTTKQIRDISKKGEQSRFGNIITYTATDVLVIKDQLDPEFVKQRDLNKTPPIIMARMSKGGVGKSSITVNTAFALALQGYRVLLIDADPQGSATALLGIDPEDEVAATIMSSMLDEKPLSEVTIQPYEDMDLYIAPADLSLSQFDTRAMQHKRREMIFSNMLDREKEFLASNFDVVVIDTAPGSSFLNFNLMVSANLILVPMMLDGFSNKALAALNEEVTDLEKYFSLKKAVLFVANGLHQGHAHSRRNLDFLRDRLGDMLAQNVLVNYVGYSRQMGVRGDCKPLIEREPLSEAASALIELSREVAAIVGMYQSPAAGESK